MGVVAYQERFDGVLPDIYTSGTGRSELAPGISGNGRRLFKPAGGGAVARVNHTVNWLLDAEDVWFGGAFLLAPGFYAAANGQVRLMGWTDYNGSPSSRIRSGIWIDSNDDVYVRRHVENHPSLNEHTPILALGNRAIPEGQWVSIDVHQRLRATNGDALTEVFLNDRQWTTTVRNIVPAAALGPITRMRWGLDDAGAVTGAISVTVDNLYVGTTRPNAPPTPPPPIDRAALLAQARTHMAKTTILYKTWLARKASGYYTNPAATEWAKAEAVLDRLV